MLNRISLIALCAALASSAAAKSTQLPLVIWHGLGDQYDSEGLRRVAELANEVNPGTFTHIIRLSDDPNQDRTSTFFGRVDRQIAQVCSQLASIPELANGFNAIGFSQGGQFMRGYVQRCNDPPVHTLITYGSQHNGITDFLPNCKPIDLVCRSTERILRNAKWTSYVQDRIVPAQYFRDPEDLENYLEHSNFLADINNERPEERDRPSRKAYRWRLSQLRRFVMVKFEDDTTVVPPQTAWFDEFNRTSGEVTSLKQRDLYKQDWIGLKKLGEKKRLEFLTVPGEHMHLSNEILAEHFEKYLGPTKDKEFNGGVGEEVEDGEKVRDYL